MDQCDLFRPDLGRENPSKIGGFGVQGLKVEDRAILYPVGIVRTGKQSPCLLLAILGHRKGLRVRRLRVLNFGLRESKLETRQFGADLGFGLY